MKLAPSPNLRDPGGGDDGLLEDAEQVGDEDEAGGGGTAGGKNTLPVGAGAGGDGEEDEADVMFSDEGGDITRAAQDGIAVDVAVLLVVVVVNKTGDGEGTGEAAFVKQPGGELTTFAGADDEDTLAEAGTTASQIEPAGGKAGEDALTVADDDKADKDEGGAIGQDAQGDGAVGEEVDIGNGEQADGEEGGEPEVEDVGGAGVAPGDAFEAEEGVGDAEEEGDGEGHEGAAPPADV